MSNRQKRIELFNHLDNQFKSGVYDYLNIKNAEIVNLSDLNKVKPINIYNSNITFLNQTTLDNIEENSLALVFISAKQPGGGILSGSKAQEEDISLRTSWYFQVKDVKNFYLDRGASAINSDNMIYAENAYLLKDEYGNDITPIPISLLGSLLQI